MSDLPINRWYRLRGKLADQERHNFLRAHIVLTHFRTDARFAMLRKRIEQTANLDIMIARAQYEFHKAKHAGNPVTCDNENVRNFPPGGAIERYLRMWDVDQVRETIEHTLEIFVEHDLKLRRMNWLAADLTTLLYFQFLEEIGFAVDVEFVFFLGEKRGRHRYQSPDQKKIDAHAAMFFRNRLKAPPDSLNALAREYAVDRKAIRHAIDAVVHLLRDPIVRV